MVRFASLFNVKEQTVTFMSRTKYSLEELWGMGMGDLLTSMFEFSEKLSALDLSEEELGLFTAVVLVSAGRQLARSRAPNVQHHLSAPYGWDRVPLLSSKASHQLLES